ncbi:MAG: hypothetical protein JOZ35_00370 [Hyphomicrobiales bacterium]|nr:hypothetical protein [Hyphomicrobiales bacterium]MBV8285356.1 hypothetical protein [Hyphomicrobiales bacterium]MBV8420166.1 hypothetical protein [Hyphomicrobiales bacterium]
MAAAAAVALAVALAWSAGSARAEDAEEEVPLDTKLFRQFMKDLGLQRDGSPIDYRERAPLVVPPSRDLPPPRDEADVVAKTPAWPKDPDVARRKQEQAAEKAKLKGNLTPEEQARALRPDELDKPGAGEKTSADAKGAGKSVEDSSRALMPSDLGTKTEKIFGSIWSSFTPAKPEQAPFTGEPPREAMTAPPSGYQTPSPNYPYGIGVQDKRKVFTAEEKLNGQQ